MSSNFRVVAEGLDPSPLLRQLEDRGGGLWSTDTEWTRGKPGSAVYRTENIVLRYVTLGQEQGRLYLHEGVRTREEWTRPGGRTMSAAWPLVHRLMCDVHAEHIGHVIITRLRPGESISPHVDRVHPLVGLPYWTRYQVPIQSDDGVLFQCGNEEVCMLPGLAYWFNSQLVHSVVNRSRSDRLSMIVDLHPMWGPE